MKSHGNKKLARKLNYADCIRKYFNTNASLEEIREVAARICRDYLTGQWKSITSSDIVVKRISGGLSNLLYHVSLPEDGSSSENAAEHLINLASGDVESSAVKRSNSVQMLDKSINGRKRQRSDSGELIGGTSATCSMTSQCESPREVLLRIYGQTHGENALEAMITESVVFALLSERNFGPKLHGIFPGGRIEQFIPARPLVTAELSDYKISMKVAEKMGEIHSLNIPMSKEPDWLWNCMERWLKSIDSIFKESISKNLETDLREVHAVDFWSEIKWLKSLIESGNYPVLFCHNDLQEGNILFRENETSPYSPHRLRLRNSSSNFDDSVMGSSEDISMMEHEPNANTLTSPPLEVSRRKRLSKDNGNKYSVDIENTRDSVLSNSSEDCTDPDLIIIDFEYCAYNYRGFDLANHFLEWTFDYSNPEFPYFYHLKDKYPTQKQRHNFITSYLKKCNEAIEDYVPTTMEIENVDKEVRVFSMFSHFFWTLWSVVNTTSNIEFGYWKYALTRIREYKQLKAEYQASVVTV